MTLPFQPVLKYVSQKHGGDPDLTRRAYWDLFPDLDVDSLPIPTPVERTRFPTWIKRQKMGDLDEALQDPKFIELESEIKRAIEILTMKRFPQKEILSLGPDNLVLVYQSFFCDFGYGIDVDAYFHLFRFPDSSHLRRICMESSDRNFIRTLLDLPTNCAGLRDQAEKLASMFLAQTNLCLIKGQFKKATLLAQAIQKTVSIFDKVEPPKSSDDLMALLSKEQNLDEPTIYSMNDLNKMAANHDK